MKRTLRGRARELLFRYPSIRRLVRTARAAQRIPLDYRVDPKPRYGHGKPAHPLLTQIIGRQREAYGETLRSFLQLAPSLASIARDDLDTAPAQPFWNNPWFIGLDIVALYSLITLRRPLSYLEVGSGQSTRVVRKAIADHGLPTRIISLDPQPRSDIDAICDEVVRGRLEDSDLGLFDRLQPGDVLFIDGSHRCFQNSDVTVFFLEVLPKLPAGVLVHIHDIWLPHDYPAEWRETYYSEQYLLGVYLLARRDDLRIVLPNAFICEDEELRHILDPLWEHPELAGIDRYGVSFWFETPAEGPIPRPLPLRQAQGRL